MTWGEIIAAVTETDADIRILLAVLENLERRVAIQEIRHGIMPPDTMRRVLH